ncbi:hypothetical protein PR048_027540 [Dryococelus australis]|uniref:Uncharacterized protein n=1 Tax=Dryococelus australis TaxID=614101 RepID=A0ABQ9GGT4_9NEOP|nr:hypothetical protein PR048_027540 [Dryococelus australis]
MLRETECVCNMLVLVEMKKLVKMDGNYVSFRLGDWRETLACNQRVDGSVKIVLRTQVCIEALLPVVRLLASHLRESDTIPPIFACENRARRCRWSAGFLRELPFPSPLHSGAAPSSPHLTFIDSQDLDIKSRVNLLYHGFPRVRIVQFMIPQGEKAVLVNIKEYQNNIHNMLDMLKIQFRPSRRQRQISQSWEIGIPMQPEAQCTCTKASGQLPPSHTHLNFHEKKVQVSISTTVSDGGPLPSSLPLRLGHVFFMQSGMDLRGPRSRIEGAIRATLRPTPSATSLLRARPTYFRRPSEHRKLCGVCRRACGLEGCGGGGVNGFKMAAVTSCGGFKAKPHPRMQQGFFNPCRVSRDGRLRVVEACRGERVVVRRHYRDFAGIATENAALQSPLSRSTSSRVLVPPLSRDKPPLRAAPLSLGISQNTRSLPEIASLPIPSPPATAPPPSLLNYKHPQPPPPIHPRLLTEFGLRGSGIKFQQVHYVSSSRHAASSNKIQFSCKTHTKFGLQQYNAFHLGNTVHMRDWQVCCADCTDEGGKASEGISAALNIGVLRADEGPADQPTCENPVTRPGIEPGSPWWEASVLIAQPPRPPMAEDISNTSSKLRVPYSLQNRRAEWRFCNAERRDDLLANIATARRERYKGERKGKSLSHKAKAEVGA